MGEEHLSAPAFTLRKVCELSSIVNGNGLEYLCKAVAIFLFEHLHGSHNSFARLSRNQESQVVFRLLFQKGKHNSVLTCTLTNHGIAFPMAFFRALRSNFRPQINAFAEVFLVSSGFGRLSVLPLYSFRQLHDPNGKIGCPRFIIERVGTDHLVARKQAVAFCVAGAGIQRPLVFSDLSSNPGYECSAGKQFVRFPGTETIGTVYSFTVLGTVARSTTLARLTGRCATPQFVPDRGRKTAQLSGNGSVGQSLPLQGLNSASFFSLKMLPALAFRQICDIMTAVHSDCTPSINVVW